MKGYRLGKKVALIFPFVPKFYSQTMPLRLTVRYKENYFCRVEKQ